MRLSAATDTALDLSAATDTALDHSCNNFGKVLISLSSVNFHVARGVEQVDRWSDWRSCLCSLRGDLRPRRLGAAGPHRRSYALRDALVSAAARMPGAVKHRDCQRAPSLGASTPIRPAPLTRNGSHNRILNAAGGRRHRRD